MLRLWVLLQLRTWGLCYTPWSCVPFRWKRLTGLMTRVTIERWPRNWQMRVGRRRSDVGASQPPQAATRPGPSALALRRHFALRGPALCRVEARLVVRQKVAIDGRWYVALR